MLLVAADDRFADHDPGPGHVERPARYAAVVRGLDRLGLVTPEHLIEPRTVSATELERVHTPEHLAHLRSVAAGGGGRLDPDTVMGPGSWTAAQLAAGAGLAAVDALRAGAGSAAFCAVRPPGHHAIGRAAMGFCLCNNIAVTAAALADAGERVAVIDWDAHHGNGTVEIFESDPRVLVVSLHEWPLYPGTGRLEETGVGPGRGTTVNVPLPAGATGDVYLLAFDTLIAPMVERFAPDWILVSAGYDAHRDDPLTGLALSAGDYTLLTERVQAWVPPGRLICFLEGGYDLAALEHSVLATASVLVGDRRLPEPPTSGGPGALVIERARSVHGV